MANFLQSLEIVKDFMQVAVDQTTTAVESVHRTVADASYQILAQGDSERLKQLKARHDATAAQVYNAIRDVNRSLGQFASDCFESVEDSAHAAEVMSANQAKSAVVTESQSAEAQPSPVENDRG